MEHETASNYSLKHTFLPTLSLFTSAGTLVCCALPALFVTLGAGASLASILGVAPWLGVLSRYKFYTFAISGVLIALSGVSLWHARKAPCPSDRAQALACTRLRKINVYIYFFSVGIWCIGFFFAFVAVKIFFP
ncbi:MAG: hypothetical protein OXC44_04625 [Proteobacteria bacterium]|nr:hypothetical protein [Pseudomonadota bacterium]